uniref:NAD(P)(+)--arginine ADP-ribosyltransferase n=1 Tax=Cryptomonas curvata TaxID=233186 RepID=A0A7S0MRC3_9CRYP|mmetsp:Transcript_51369/g.107313  ORF Transcript_51369/g.107313 Transcript_51369/m.107313 type:complete len:210 (+) Transcript_51369:947-1576(+)
MEAEHCSRPDSDLLFKSPCGETVTSAKVEWMTVIEKSTETVIENSEACKLEGDRIVPKISHLALGGMMAKEEIISVVLYTGPMFVKYNCILRRHPAEEYEDQKSMNSLYTTTICLLVSALVKIARSQVNTPRNRVLYRGLSGEDPFALWLPCHSGQGLTSTTKDQTVALKFSGVNKGKPWPTIYEISSGDLQHGADVTFFSQYPGTDSL